MTVEINDTVERYTVSGVGPYAFNFRIFAATDLQVTACSATSPSVPTLLTYLTHYTVDGVNESDGGTVTLVNPAQTTYAGFTLDIRSVTPKSQPTSIRNTARFLPEIHEDALDNLSRQIQDLERTVEGCFRYPDNVLNDGTLTPLSGWLSKYLTINANGQLEAAALSANALTASVITSLLSGSTTQQDALLALLAERTDAQPALISLKPTTAETSAGITIINKSYAPKPYDLRRAGLVANNPSAATFNTNALKSLIDPSISALGPAGGYILPNIGGNDYYAINNIVQLRRKVRFDLDYARVAFAKSRETTDNLMGFFTLIGDAVIENGLLDASYDGTGGINAGAIFRIGSRLGYPYGTVTGGILEETLTTPMGNIVLRNLRLTTTNPACPPILLLGGLRGVRVENVTIDCGGAPSDGVYYEFGDYHYEATVANRKTTHASGLYFGGVTIKNLDAGISSGSGISLVGAADAIIESLTVDGANTALSFRPGEALYYNPGPDDSGLVKRCITITNMRAKNVASGMSLIGAESKAFGYLNTESLTESQQTDLMRFSVDGGILNASGVGINVTGPCDIRNVTLNGTASSGQLIIGDECIRGTFTNCEIRNSTGIGVRANFGDHLWATARLKTLQFINCQVAGNVGAGYSFGHTKSVEIHGGRIGYQTVLDGVAETTQTIGVSVDQTSVGGGVYAYGVDVATSGGVAYSLTGTITNPCGVFHPKGTVTFTGAWDRDGAGQSDSSSFTDKTAYLNVAGKYAGRLALNTTDHKLYTARGATDVSPWDVADASASITPA